MEVLSHFFVFFLGLSLSVILRHGFARSSDSTDNQYFVSAVLTFVGHKGNRIERYYSGSFWPESRDADKMVKEFKGAFIKLVTKNMPEEVFQLADKDNYHIQIYSMNKV